MIILTTLNARHSHASLGLRYLMANLGELEAHASLREFTINDNLGWVAEQLIALSPRIIGFGVYIWNLRETTKVVAIIRRVAPGVRIVVGGPEVSHEHEHEPLVAMSDVLIVGEADLAFPPVCAALLEGRAVPKVVRAPKPAPASISFPYARYTDDDLRHRIIYVEASRGCPFTCEFCLSSIENGVRSFPLEGFLAELDGMIRRGCRVFKFVDRTFNLGITSSSAILAFFLERWPRDPAGTLIGPDPQARVADGLPANGSFFLHFEMVPDRLPDALKDLLARFPRGSLQLEVGIQSFTPRVGELISRRMDRAKTEDNLRWLRDAGIHVHADLIIGLPGETVDSFADSFDALWRLGPGEIQVGILKLLKGTPLARHREPFAMAFNPEPPYDILKNRDLDFPTMQRLKRFARYFELYANSGRFARGVGLLMSGGASPFRAFLEFSDRLWSTTHQEHAISQTRQYELIGEHLRTVGQLSAQTVIAALAQDFLDHGQRKHLPEFLRPTVESGRRDGRARSIDEVSAAR